MTKSPAPNRSSTSRKGRPDQPQPAKPGLRRWVLPAMLGAAALAIVAIVVLGGAGKPPASTAAPVTSAASGGAGVTGPSALTLGQPTATVQLDEYGDFQCTSCESFFQGTEPQLKSAYIDTGRVRLVWHDFPWIGQESLDAANAARCAADQGRFWDYHDLLYRSQGGENSGAFSVANLKAFGAKLGLDATAFNACVDGNTHLAQVKADLATAAASGFPGTPTFLLGGQKIIGAQPFATFAKALDAALAK